MAPWYHTSSELQSEAKRLVDGCGGRALMRNHSHGGVTLETIYIAADRPDATNRVFITFGEHSRELISPETGLEHLRQLCGESATTSKVKVEDVLKDSSFTLVLNANPRSRAKVESGEYCLRTNPNGVDLNRNYNIKWEPGATIEGQSTNPGPHPFSEPETQIMKSLLETLRPTTYLTVHSGVKGMYMPWAWSTDLLENDTSQSSMMQVLRALDKDHCRCPYGAAGKEVGYAAPGTSLDFARTIEGNLFSFAFEIACSKDADADFLSRYQREESTKHRTLLQHGKSPVAASPATVRPHVASLLQAASHAFRVEHQSEEGNDCFPTYNPTSRKEYEEVTKNWAAAFLEMAHLTRNLIRKGAAAPAKL